MNAADTRALSETVTPEVQDPLGDVSKNRPISEGALSVGRAQGCVHFAERPCQRRSTRRALRTRAASVHLYLGNARWESECQQFKPRVSECLLAYVRWARLRLIVFVAGRCPATAGWSRVISGLSCSHRSAAVGAAPVLRTAGQ